MSIFGPVIASAAIEDAVRSTLQRWLDTMLCEVERQSDGRWALREIERPRSWQLVTDYRSAKADRLLPCIAVETVDESFSYTGDGTVNSETTFNVIVITKGQTRDKTRETLSALVTAVLMVLEKHGDLDEFAVGTVVGDVTRDAVEGEKAKTVAGASIPITVLVDGVRSKRGGPVEPDDPPPVAPPDDHGDYPDRTSTNVAVAYKEA